MPDVPQNRTTEEAAALAAPFLGLIMRYRLTWTGGPIGTGYTTLFATGTAAQTFADGAAAFFVAALGTGAAGGLPSGVSVAGDSFVDIIDTPTGLLTDSQAITAPATLAGANTQQYAAPAGAVVTWSTLGVVNGQRVRGRTFFVPLSSSKYDPSGTLLDAFRTSMQAAASTYRAGSWSPCVYHRPIAQTGGSAFLVTSSSVKDRVAILTTRR